MNRLPNDSVLAEKTMNTPPNVDKTAKNPPTITKRAPLTKAYSCSDASPPTSPGQFAFITPKQFVELVFPNHTTIPNNNNTNNGNSQHKIPILDCRSQMDYGCEHIRSSFNVNCRTKIMQRKLSSKRLEEIEPTLSVSLNNSDTIILYDQSTDAKSQEKLHLLPINLVVQAAQKSNKRVQIIQGGLNAVKNEYPHVIECPSESFQEKFEQDLILLPSSPDAIDKENILMTEIVPHIFVGNIFDAQDRDRLTKNGITHIINCTPDLPFCWEKSYECKRIAVFDSPSQNIRKYFDEVIDFIDNALRVKTNNILVHCSAGISRSPTLVLAYMMKKERLTLDDAFDKMRKLRNIVDPNVSFIIQLREWEKSIMSTMNTAAGAIASAADMNDDNSGINTSTNSTRSASNTYCGSTSKSKTDTKTCSDAVIIVN